MSTTISCYAYLNAKIKPISRGKMFETPLEIAVAERGIGTVEGGGTLQAKDGEIIHCGIDLELVPSEQNLQFVCQFLTDRGAPKGSKLQFDPDFERAEIAFGQLEGLGLYLNGTDLPKEVYQTCDINVVMEKLDQLTNDACQYCSYWEGRRETSLYFYGPSFDELAARTASFVAEYPLCQRARVVRIA